jgi:flavin reductase (DIM6/NTAB) family NADH-FMN oxidoreductase RutF
MAALEFRTIEPKIRYFGTPVALISSLYEDGATNLAPMSSFWALGWTLVLGVLHETRVQNLHRISGAKLEQLGSGIAAEVEIVRVHVANDFVLGDRYIDPADLQLPALLPPCRARTGKNISCGAIGVQA